MNNEHLKRVSYAIYSKSNKGWVRKHGQYSKDFSHARLFTGKNHAKSTAQWRLDVVRGTNDLLIIPITIEVDDKDLFMRIIANKSE